MRSFWKYFKGSTVFSILALVAAFFIGQSFGNSVAAGFAAVFTTLMLGILETSLSFDNAVVNARVLGTMSRFWKRMFLTVGMLIAVFGMRIVFPLLIVWLVSDQSFWSVVKMTWENPHQFQDILIHQHILISGFGGAFLWMVFTKFFFDTEKEVHWLPGLERLMARIGRVEAVWVAIAMILTFVFYSFIPHEEQGHFLIAAFLGILTYIVVEGMSSLLQSSKAKPVEGTEAPATTHGPKKATRWISAGFASFLYLEVLDASFSFDGVIGAFAITDNLFIIALGLGIGAFFVRSLTIKLVEDKTLTAYVYLEHGAFWAIGALSLIMYISALGVEVPEVVSGSVGLVFIALSFLSSIFSRKKAQHK